MIVSNDNKSSWVCSEWIQHLIHPFIEKTSRKTRFSRWVSVWSLDFLQSSILIIIVTHCISFIDLHVPILVMCSLVITLDCKPARLMVTGECSIFNSISTGYNF
ncbi:hypothetical protein L6452_28636 [Arctium lappa]|uniref:Uncharacterized protein n=1 Tax=Arctium lappa TaxID=4217 RepID=A0ACB8ZZ12_ARCLA|nr:hypothetical protein L6452_28636 [Arctium lappa]